MTIGFFSPLPLAMMIPFMATQSLAMGEAFGKSFQYGKRKISSMSNEEFNKYTIQDMMQEQTADIRTLIPELTKQMQMSSTMQQQIFEEMIKLVPAFVNAIEKQLTGSQGVALSNLDSNIQGAKDIISGLIPSIPEAHATSQIQGPPAPSNLPNTFAQHIAIQKDLLSSSPTYTAPYTTPAEKRIPSAKTLQTAQDQVWITWSSKLGKLKAQHTSLKHQLTALAERRRRNPSIMLLLDRQRDTLTNQKRSITSQIRTMSNQYRHANNNIRENALRLRREMASGQWK